ncbi:hypothetical protein EV127DRAFT_514720 [Xylaria flabelliformis]|nr:hypothetical protein EV127DRAFT_514720 [Xylaria flabelliformis]
MSLGIEGFNKLAVLEVIKRGYDLDDLRSLLSDCTKDKANAYVTAKDIYGTALHCALFRELSSESAYSFVDLLIGHAENKQEYVAMANSFKSTALHLAAIMGNVKVMERLINLAGNKDEYITAKDSNGWTALHHAIDSRKFEFAKTLVTLCGNRRDCINKQCDSIRTPLHFAVQEDGDMTLFLLKQDANPRITDERGMTAWDDALMNLGDSSRWDVIAAFIIHEQGGLRLKKKNFRNLAWVYGTFESISAAPKRGEINRDPIGMLASILRQIHREFNVNQETDLQLRSREPSCNFYRVDEDEDCKSYDFGSLVHNERQDGHKDQTLQACVGKDHEFLKGFMPLTLDEYCSPALSQKVLNGRNRDQVLGRYEKARRGEGPLARTQFSYSNDALALLISNDQQPLDAGVESVPSPLHVVLVRQAWIWRVDETVVTNLSPKMFPDVDVSHSSTYSTFGYITRVFRIIVEHFESGSHKATEPLLKTYENALSVVSENVNVYVQKARVEDIDLHKEKELFHEISDLREELSMIKSVLAEQEEVWNEFLDLTLPSHGSVKQLGNQQRPRSATLKQARRYRPHDRVRKTTTLKQMLKPKQPQRYGQDEESRDILKIQTMFDKYRRRIAKLEQDAERVERDVSTQLDLKQKHATIKESHSLAVLSATVFGFTIITVIFAPLSFVVALFALPIDKFNEGKYGNDKEGAYSSDYISKWSAATELVSISITLVTMWAALRFTGLHVWGKKGLREYVRQKADASMEEREFRTPDLEEGKDRAGLGHGLQAENENNDIIYRDATLTFRRINQ